MKPNPFVITSTPPGGDSAHKKPTKTEHDPRCPVCGKDQLAPAQWRVCIGKCDESLSGWNDAPIEVMKAWTGVAVWAAPRAGEA